MTLRQIRRAAERRQRKLARKSAKSAGHVGVATLPGPPTPEFVSQNPPTRAEINRANSLHSTGPATPAGKLASSRNSLKHGLASGTLIIPGEDPAALETLRSALLEEHQPGTQTEHLLIEEMSQSWWLAQRAIRLQSDCFTDTGIDEKRLSLLIRYQTTHQRAFHKALSTLSRLQKERRQTQRGFVSQNHVRAAESPDPPENGFVSQNHLVAAALPGRAENEFVSQNGTDPRTKAPIALRPPC